MKLIHTSDLHIGKQLNGFSLLEDQEYILKQIISVAKDENADALLIAGDIYDKPIPSAEAVRAFDLFLTALSDNEISVFIISGNHDSSERISFGARLMRKSRIYFSPVFDGNIAPVSVNDDYGEVLIYMLPFIKPAHINHILETSKSTSSVSSYDEAVRLAVSKYMSIDKSKRNIIVAHQFVTGARTCESEEMSVGGTENISADIFSDFDYTALGHIHSPQAVSSKLCRYSGTPLKYSFSEAGDKKSVTVVELKEKGNITLTEKLLSPLRDMRIIKGLFGEIIAEDTVRKTDDYVKIILCDEYDIPNAMGRLRSIFPNLMHIEYLSKHNFSDAAVSESAEEKRRLSSTELLSEFYELQNGMPLSDEQKKLAEKIFEEIQEEQLQ